MKVLLKLGFVNAALLMLYIGSDYLEWRNLLGLPGIADVLWTPIRITIWISSTSAFGPAIIDGVSWMDNWSFMKLLTIIAVNLATMENRTEKNFTDSLNFMDFFWGLDLG